MITPYLVFNGNCKEALEFYQLPPTETFYSTFHAALTDKFGIAWNIVAEEAPNHKQ